MRPALRGRRAKNNKGAIIYMKKRMIVVLGLFAVMLLSTLLTGCTGGTMAGKWEMLMTEDLFRDTGLYDPNTATKTIQDMMQSYKFVVEITDDGLFITSSYVDGVLSAASGEYFTMSGNNLHFTDTGINATVKLSGSSMTITYENGTVIVFRRLPDDAYPAATSVSEPAE